MRNANLIDHSRPGGCGSSSSEASDNKEGYFLLGSPRLLSSSSSSEASDNKEEEQRTTGYDGSKEDRAQDTTRKGYLVPHQGVLS